MADTVAGSTRSLLTSVTPHGTKSDVGENQVPLQRGNARDVISLH